MILKLDENDFSHGLVATYENAARKAGFPVTDGSRYDCRHICVAENKRFPFRCADSAYYRRLY